MIALIILIRSHNLCDPLERVLAALNTPERLLDWHAEAGPGKWHVLEHMPLSRLNPRCLNLVHRAQVHQCIRLMQST